jgi:hypothetical protein
VIVKLATALSGLSELKRKLAIECCFVHECHSHPATLTLDGLAAIKEVRNA